MAIKLGELLVQEGLVSQEDLEEALKFQVIYGGKLGTNLIEMGLVEEGQIAKMLSKKLGVPYVAPEKLQNLPKDLLALIPAEIAEKHSVVPVGRENKKLFLAMSDPTNLLAIDEIAFRTGFIIKPVLTPEVRLVLALEQYYDVARERRYIPLEKRVAKAPRKPKPPVSPARPAPAPPRPEVAEEEFIEIPGLEALEEIEELEEIEPLVETEDLAMIEVIEDLVEEVAEADVIEEYSLELISRLLAEAGEREDIADIIIGYLGQEFDRGALFQVRSGLIIGWRGMVNEKNCERFPEVEIALTEPSVLQTVVESRSTYLGPIGRSDANDRIFQGLGGYLAPTGLMVPIQIMGRVVGILYVDGEGIDLSARTVDMQKLATKAGMAFEVLILKKKILML